MPIRNSTIMEVVTEIKWEDTVEAVEEVVEEEDSEEAVVVMGIMVVVEVATIKIINRTMEDKWEVVKEDINKTSREVAEAKIHNIKQKCAEIKNRKEFAIMVINASMHIAKRSSVHLNRCSSELLNHNSNKNK